MDYPIEVWWYLLVLASFIILNDFDMLGRRWQTRPFNTPEMRARYGAFASVFTYFKLEDNQLFYRFMRMRVCDFAILYEKLKDKLKKSGPRALSAELKLAAVIG